MTHALNLYVLPENDGKERANLNDTEIKVKHKLGKKKKIYNKQTL